MDDVNTGVEPGFASADVADIVEMLRGIDPKELRAKLRSMTDEELASLAGMVSYEKLMELVEEEPVSFGDMAADFKEKYRESLTAQIESETTLALSIITVRNVVNIATCVAEVALGRSLREKEHQFTAVNRVLRIVALAMTAYGAILNAREIRRRVEAGERMFIPRERQLNLTNDVPVALTVAFSSYELASGNSFVFRAANRRRLTRFGRAQAVWRVAGDSVVLYERLRSYRATK